MPMLAQHPPSEVTVEELRKEIGRRVREARQRLRLTQTELADALDLEEVSVRAIEAGRRGLSVDSLIRMARALHIPPAELLEEAGTGECRDEIEATRLVHDMDPEWRATALQVLRALHARYLAVRGLVKKKTMGRKG
jgi:transcriptional regulator with XRE-family HTH domain